MSDISDEVKCQREFLIRTRDMDASHMEIFRELLAEREAREKAERERDEARNATRGVKAALTNARDAWKTRAERLEAALRSAKACEGAPADASRCLYCQRAPDEPTTATNEIAQSPGDAAHQACGGDS